MSKISYDAAFNMLEAQSNACSKLDELGCRFEYSEGLLGQFMFNLMRSSETIIIDALNLHEVSIPIECNINGMLYPTTIEILYPEDNDADWAITMDDFYEFLSVASKFDNAKDLLWNAIVLRKEDAKLEFNSLKHGQIGTKFSSIHT